mmetsp:Transcript_8905/g.6666  ORF Transcript_8905/g.6666 Transcript_8905/m.6666 type:complete len:180 (-) Transcript_8905:58-597(-)
MESRGNSEGYEAGGVNSFGSTLHWGPDWSQNRYYLSHQDYFHTTGLDEEFHVYGLYWDEDKMYTYLDDESNKVLDLDFTSQSFFERGGFSDSIQNPWVGEDNSAPFNREFYLILNVAVGGTNAYFPDGVGGKPWTNDDPNSVNAFWNAKDQWYSTWEDEKSALRVDWVKVWSLDSEVEQ